MSMTGYRMPAEWERHEATWLAWPHEKADWPGKFAPVPWVYGAIVRYLSRVETVRILIPPGGHKAVETVLRKSGASMERVELFEVATDRSWTRDTCPIFVKNDAGQVGMTHWRFNGWAKYDNHKHDARIPLELRRLFRKLPYYKPMVGKKHVVLEGGSIDVNGAGTLLTTEECLLSPVQARNPGFTREQIEQVLGEWLGVRHVLWLKDGIEGDDTHGHVDDLARFVNPTTVVVASETDRGERNYAILAENYKRLQHMRDQNETPLQVVKLPMPRPVIFDGQRLPASYANFYIANGLVLVPVFNDQADREALNILARLFKDREVVPIYCGDLVLGLGTLHCATQQQPQ